MHRILWTLALGAAVLVPGFAGAGELIMKNGSRLIGEVMNAADGKIKFKTPFAGTLEINVENVDTMYTDKEVTVVMKDGRVIENQRIVARDNAMIMMSENMEAVLFEAEDMKSLNPDPWELGHGYKWFGDINTTMLIERGNTDTNELDVNGASTWRSLRDRYTIAAYYELDEANNERNKNKWRWRNKYDRFNQEDPDTYWGMLLAFEGDEFSDLDLRTTIGPYIGRQFFESSYLDLRGEVGLVWVDEQLDPSAEEVADGAPDQNDYPGSAWALYITSDFFGGSSDFYVNHDGTMNFDETDALLLNTTIGIKFTVYGGIKTGVEARFEYDGGVGPDRDEMDETYNVFVGYEW